MTKTKKPAPIREAIVRKPLDPRSLLERAADDDPALSVHFELAEGLLRCRHCDFVSAQENNALAHLEIRHGEAINPPAEAKEA